MALGISSGVIRCSSWILPVALFVVCCLLYADVTSAADDELHQLGLGHLNIIGTRFVDEHHEIHDYPKDSSDKSDDGRLHSSSEDSDYHNPIYDHVHIHKDDYSNFGGKSSDSTDSSDDHSDHKCNKHS